MNVDEIKAAAEKELKEEQFKLAVQNYKEKLKNKKSLLDRLFPFKIIIVKKGD